MKNTVEYYYNIKIANLIPENNYYLFYFNNDKFYLVLLDRPYQDLILLNKLVIELKNKGVITSEIIFNIENKLFSIINNQAYVLLKSSKYENNAITYNDINYIQLNTYNINYDKMLLRNNWVKLWSEKIDYYEYQMTELRRKYKILHNTIDYYIGLGENAILYIINNKEKLDIKNYVVSHKRINISNSTFEFFNPLSYVIDSRVRDTAEFIKDSFFKDKITLNEVFNILNYNNYSYSEYILFISRLLFPSYYFDIYDEIVNNNLNENNIEKIVNKSSSYETFLNNIINYIYYEKRVFIDQIDWLKKDASY